MEERDDARTGKTMDAEQVLGEAGVVDDVGEVKSTPSACRATEAQRAIANGVALQDITIGHAYSDTTIGVDTREKGRVRDAVDCST